MSSLHYIPITAPAAISVAAAVWVGVGRGGAEVPIRLLLADPLEERLQQRRIAKCGEVGVAARQVRVRKRGVNLLVARPAKRSAVLGLAALLARREVVLRDETLGHESAAQLTALNVDVSRVHAQEL